MTLQELLDQLSHAEFSQLDLGGGSNGVHPRDYPRMVSAINATLAALHTRFRLKNGEVTLELQDGQTIYYLDNRYATANTYSREPVKYIVDDSNPFKNDVLLIESIQDADRCDLGLNEVDNRWAFKTLDPDRTIVAPDWTDADYPGELAAGSLVTVKYRRNHRKLVEEDWDDPECSAIALPYAYLQALCYGVASRLLTPLGGTRDNGHDGNNYASKYEAECLRLEVGGVQIAQQHDADKFRMRGFR